eukprot:TRINITY_DN1610_c2_g2_i3.p1 TRINITY_DN1610_c2_g2~~TRINITY_DN1610_c2_g2_i3.p1  ORF type:complete len:376 (-),score=76.89 TRINITY_DN1610_c2_g2_i3:87-1154(-)
MAATSAAEALRAAAQNAGRRVFGRAGLSAATKSKLFVAAALPPGLALASRNNFDMSLAPSFKAFVTECPSAAHCEASPAVSSSIPKIVETFPEDVCLKKSVVRLYQFESCPFCRKVRGCLDYERIPYEIIEVHPLSKAETKRIASDYKKVPIVEVESDDGRSFQMRDSKTIVNALLGRSNPGVAAKVPSPAATASTGKMWTAEDASVAGSVEEQWIRWTDKVLVQCIVLNVYRNMKESAETFQYLLTHSEFPWFAQRSAAFSGTVVMYAVAKMRKRKFEVPDERVALYEACDAFASAVKTGGKSFLGGDRPGAVDFNVYGILRSTEACQTERDLAADCPSLTPWYDVMKAATLDL